MYQIEKYCKSLASFCVVEYEILYLQSTFFGGVTFGIIFIVRPVLSNITIMLYMYVYRLPIAQTVGLKFSPRKENSFTISARRDSRPDNWTGRRACAVTPMTVSLWPTKTTTVSR